MLYYKQVHLNTFNKQLNVELQLPWEAIFFFFFEGGKNVIIHLNGTLKNDWIAGNF